MHEKTAEEVRRNEWEQFFPTTRIPTDQIAMAKAAFEAGFSAGRRGERIEVAARLMTVVLGQ